MAENVLAKLTSSRWLREAVAGRARDLVNTIGFSPTIIEREVAGERYSFYIGNPIGKSWYSTKVDISHEMTFVKENLVRKGDTVIECGAHHGAGTILLSRWVGDDGKVIVVEPVPDNLAILRRNIEINELRNVIVIPKAAGNSSGRVIMSRKSNAAVTSRQPGAQSASGVECVTLDSIVQDLGVVPDLVKIDVEGFEYRVLEGSKSILSTVPALFVEVHTLTLPRYGDKFEDIWKHVDPSCYDIFVQEEDSDPPTPYTMGTRAADRMHLFFTPKTRTHQAEAM